MLNSKMPFLKKKKQKLLSIQVSTYNAELEFSVDSGEKVKTVFDLVCHSIGLRETWYFGLSYIHENNKIVWLKLDKKILDFPLPRNENGCIFLKFSAKYYPEILEEELIQEATRHLFYLQFQHLILSEELHCSPEACVYLASYAVQAKFGDYDPDIHRPGFLSDERLLPQRVVEQFPNAPDQMWEEQIKNWYAGHHGLTRDEAELEYLKIIQGVEMWGVNYFKVKDGNGREMWLGIDAKSVSIYAMANKQKAIKSYQWSELTDMSYRGNNFMIRLTERLPSGTGTLTRRRLNWKTSTTNLENTEQQSEDLCFITEDQSTNKMILDLCRGNHDLFMRRRSVDSMELQHMKAQAKEERERKQAERERLKKEIDLRKQLQMEKDDLEEKLRRFQEETRMTADTLGRSEETAELLSEKAKLAEEEAILLNVKVSRAESEVQRYKNEIVKLQEDNRTMQQNFKKLDQLTQQLAEVSKAKSAENENLRNELNATKQALLEANLQISRMSNTSLHHSPSGSGYIPGATTHGQVLAIHTLSQNGSANPPGHSPSISGSSTGHAALPYHVVYSPKRSSNGSEISSQADRNSRELANSTTTTDIQQLSQEIERERVEYQVKSRTIEQQIQTLRSELEVLKVEDGMMLVNQPPIPSHHPDLPMPQYNEVQPRSQQFGGL